MRASTTSFSPISGLQGWLVQRPGVEVLDPVMVPIFIGTLAIALQLFKSMNKGGAIKKLCIRIASIGLSLPLLGSMFTGVLISM